MEFPLLALRHAASAACIIAQDANTYTYTINQSYIHNKKTLIDSNMYNEKKFQTDFAAWLRKKQKSIPIIQRKTNFWHRTMALEYKALPTNKRLNWKSHLQPQQLPSLYKAKHGCIYKKISDIDPSLKPFDAFQICHSPAFLVVCWFSKAPTLPRTKTVYLLDPDIILREIDQYKTKSLTQQRAEEIATLYFDLGSLDTATPTYESQTTP